MTTFGPGSPLIPGLTCPRCGAAMRWGNVQQTAVECVEKPRKHRNQVEKIHHASGQTSVTLVRVAKYPERYLLPCSSEQHEQIVKRGGATYLRKLLDMDGQRQ